MLYKLSFIKASKHRTNILKSLAEREKTPKQLSIELNIKQNQVSTTLRGLKEQELVECINPEMRKGRLYRLTDKGDELVKKIK